MKVISPCTHGYFDFLIAVIFLLAPKLLVLGMLPAILAYGFAAIHLTVTMVSNFSFGAVNLIPFTVYGWIERMIGSLLITIPFILNFSNEETARNFYIAIGITIIAISLLTDYQAE